MYVGQAIKLKADRNPFSFSAPKMCYLVIFVFFSFSAENRISFSSAFSFTAENEKCIFGRPLHQTFQIIITPYVNDFQTLNNPGSGQPVGALKK